MQSKFVLTGLAVIVFGLGFGLGLVVADKPIAPASQFSGATSATAYRPTEHRSGEANAGDSLSVPMPIGAVTKLQELSPIGPPSVFAVTGSQCPDGSMPYRGPEQTLAALGHMTYCEFRARVQLMPRPKLPPGMPEAMKASMPGTTCQLPMTECKFDDANLKPSDDMMWCCMQMPVGQPALRPNAMLPAKTPMLPPLLPPDAGVLSPPSPTTVTPNRRPEAPPANHTTR